MGSRFACNSDLQPRVAPDFHGFFARGYSRFSCALLRLFACAPRSFDHPERGPGRNPRGARKNTRSHSRTVWKNAAPRWKPWVWMKQKIRKNVRNEMPLRPTINLLSHFTLRGKGWRGETSWFPLTKAGYCWKLFSLWLLSDCCTGSLVANRKPFARLRLARLAQRLGRFTPRIFLLQLLY